MCHTTMALVVGAAGPAYLQYVLTRGTRKVLCSIWVMLTQCSVKGKELTESAEHKRLPTGEADGNFVHLQSVCVCVCVGGRVSLHHPLASAMWVT
jgi:hypothetical protein